MEDEVGFVAFYRATYARVVSAVLPVVGNRAEAEDVAQEAFARAADRWDRIRGYEDPEGWVRRVAYNEAVSVLRTARRRAAALLRRSGARAPAPDPMDSVVLVQALKQLPKQYRTVLTLYYLLDLPIPQIAEELDVPVATVRTRLVRGRRRLAELLGAPVTPTVLEASRAQN